VIKRLLSEHLENDYLVLWRQFIRRIKQSNPFKIAWDKSCIEKYSKVISLQKDTPTRWSSTVSMMEKCASVKDAVLDMISKAPDSQKVLF